MGAALSVMLSMAYIFFGLCNLKSIIMTAKPDWLRKFRSRNICFYWLFQNFKSDGIRTQSKTRVCVLRFSIMKAWRQKRLEVWIPSGVVALVQLLHFQIQSA
jgi:hypothetical protein